MHRISIDADGWCAQARRVESPNADARPEPSAIELVVIHNISVPPGVFDGDAVERLFTNRLDAAEHPYFEQIHALRVSSHFFVRRSGELVQFVSCGQRAWHAGVSRWRGRDRCNDFSIGIEVEGTDDQPYTTQQYEVVAALVRAVRAHYPTIVGVCGHEHIAPGRKTDPGPAFDWPRLATLAALPSDALRV